MSQTGKNIWLLALSILLAFSCRAAEVNGAAGSGYVADKENVRSFFSAVAAQMDKNIIVSKQAARKQISGTFSFAHPQQLLNKLSLQLGLIWYDDGQMIYLYDASETRSTVVSLRNVTLREFNEFLQRSGLADKRFPLREDGRSDTFYVSGPPIFIDLVTKAAKLMDQRNEGIALGLQKIAIIPLKNTFVTDRDYELRDQKIVIPGIATVIENLLSDRQSTAAAPEGAAPSPNEPVNAPPDFLADEDKSFQLPDVAVAMADLPAAGETSDIKVIAYPNTNSLLVKGTGEQVRFIENLVTALDTTKRHIELSLWIIDLSKEDLEQLGTNWSGSISVGNSLGISLNQTTGMSTLDGTRFIASIHALEQKQQATVISRPIVLTQENIPAIFDNNRTFYARLVGERYANLEHVTYGTLISVLPRFSGDGQIEMTLNIEDGREVPATDSDTTTQGSLPEVGRTRISTIARVPQGKSLLLGGYTRDSMTQDNSKVPLLGSIPLIGSLFSSSSKGQSNTVRVFLIQPREIVDPLPTQASDIAATVAQRSGIDEDSLQKWVRSYLDTPRKGRESGR